MEHEGYKLMAEIADLRDKVGDFGLQNDYLDCKVLELEDTIECQRRSLTDYQER
jgi:hypothetical protein